MNAETTGFLTPALAALVGFLVAIAVRRARRPSPPADVPAPGEQPAATTTKPAAMAPLSVRPPADPDVPVPFGYKCGWLAIWGIDPETIIETLDLQRVRPCGWPEGIDAAYEGACFVSPVIDGWVLVVSTRLPDMGDSRFPNRILPDICALSEELDTTVQYFATHRVVEYHAWAWAEKGHIRRAYGYVGEQGATLANEGAPTPQELELGLDFSLAPFTDETLSEEAFDNWKYPNESHVMAVAAGWSVDTLALGSHGAKVGTGFLGYLREVDQ